ncbi:toll/interleukin-1 receptor domain-containing protein [Streptomyces sp. bgisy153]|uniref:toll/interleukin-1 receptor domain-containing protein n=1 Tax=Streptomyces sp. bgisy153 TaxID=3413793 RepID=UPI003D7558EF
MRIVVYQDASLDLRLEELVARIAHYAPSLGVTLGSAPFEIPSTHVSCPASYRLLPRRLLDETRSFDLSLLLTEKPYDNNFFHEQEGSLVIASAFGWEQLTDLPRENGALFFIIERALYHIDAGFDHYSNTGCVSDFLWEKSGIDSVMRAAYLCRDCREATPGDIEIRFPGALDQLQILLDHLSRASRRNMNIVDYWIDLEPPAEQFDAFLCHNSRDKPGVRDLANALRLMGLNPWLDEEQLPPGRPWQDLLQDQIDQVKSALICVGESGRGPWQNMELRGFMMAFVERGCPVIPVILPSANDIPDLPIFLRAFTWVDFRRSEPDPLRMLLWGITGVRSHD